MKGKKLTEENWLKRNQKNFLFLGIGIAIGIVVMGLFWPQRIAQLSNGEEVIVSIDGKAFTANELYKELKNNGGIDALLRLVDLQILKEKYTDETEAEEYAKEQSSTFYKMYEQSYGYTKEQFLTANNFANETEFMDYLKEQFLYEKYYKDYLAKQIKDKEVEDYYKNTVDGKKKVYILTSNDEKNDLNKAISALKKGNNFNDVANKYTKLSANDLGEIDFETYGSYSKTFLQELKKLGKGEVSEVFKDDNLGNTIIYVEESAEKPSLEDCKDKIKEVLSEKIGSEDETLYYKAFIKMREEKNIKFSDTEMEDNYKNYKKQYTTSSKSE